MATPETSSSRLSGLCIHGNSPATCAACAEDAKKAAAERKEREEIERFFDAKLEFLIAEHAQYLAEGNNGVVFKLNLEELPEELRTELKDSGVASEGEKAIKILKVYSKGKGEAEYALQQQAYEIASSKKDDPRYAQVPRPWKFRDVAITPGTADKLKGKSRNFKASDRIEVLIMDYVPGQDLATHLYREIVKRSNRFSHLAREADQIPLEQLEADVNPVIDVRIPGGKGKDESGRIHEQLMIELENAGKLVKFLSQKTDLQVDPSIVEQFSNTLRLFHENGFVLRDAHLRNFMVTGQIGTDREPGTERPRAFFIDFENAVRTPPGLSEDEIKDRYIKAAEGIEGKNFLDPWTPIRLVERLVAPPQERNDESKKDRAELDAALTKARQNIALKLQRSPEALKPFESSLRAALAKGDPGRDEAFAVFDRFYLGNNEGDKMDGFLAVGEDICASSPEFREAFRRLLDRLLESPAKKRGVRPKVLGPIALNKAGKFLTLKK